MLIAFCRKTSYAGGEREGLVELRGDRGSPKTKYEFLGVHGRGTPRAKKFRFFFVF